MEGKPVTDTRFEYKDKPKEVQRAIEEEVQAGLKMLFEKYSANRLLAYALNVPAEKILAHHLQYFRVFAEHGIRALIVGAYYGPNYENISTFDVQIQVEHIKKHRSRLSPLPPSFASTSSIMHDLMHSFVALWRSGGGTTSHALIPLFQSHTQNSADYPDNRSRLTMYNFMQTDERLVYFFDFADRTLITKAVKETTEDAFVTRFMHGEGDEYAEKMLRRIHRGYIKDGKVDELFFLDMFFEVTLPFMQKNAPQLADTYKRGKRHFGH